ncbi:response regulator [Spirulina sp. 06S082]|uniref:response regulator n=1 Tax=Spirulina sp. 06S082 TaxID=3110248 RepID=UPI002B20F237|nr:response regulator [Spirulina sp. 06S082]MEA5467921.1 response regulator [Spirulina sp. 06S082]
MRFLLVEDDEILAQTLSMALVEQNYIVDLARDGEEGWDYARSFTYDLMLLDVSLPKLDGIALCRRLRSENYHNPILLLTAKDSSADKVMGLDAGADDYVVKPCTVPELFARIRALLRRLNSSGAPILEWGDLSLDPSICEASWQNQLLPLSPKEYGLLELFLRNPKRVFSKSAILEHLWSFDDPPGEETVRAHIKGLRRKMRMAQAFDPVETVYGMGYRLKEIGNEKVENEEEGIREERERKREKETQSKQKIKEQDKDVQTLNAVSQIWGQFKGAFLERLEEIEKAIAALSSKNLSEIMRDNAEREAHKLIGSLGMYGLTQGSNWARELELAFIEIGKTSTRTATKVKIQQLQTLVHQVRQEIESNAQIASLQSSFSHTAIDNTSTSENQSQNQFRHQSQTQVVLLVDDDPLLTQELQQEALKWNIRMEIAEDIYGGREAIAKEQPALVLLDLGFPASPREGLILLKELNERDPDLPVLVLTGLKGFNERVAVARLGGKGFLTKPVSSAQVLEKVIEVLDRQSLPPKTILAVDDDPLLLARLEQFLASGDYNIQTLGDPRLFWETLNAIVPDLLILDVEMPYINGIELCQVIRNDPTWKYIPILFLSANRDRETIHRIYQVGGDDYICKPVTEPELITRIVNRLDRFYLLDNLTRSRSHQNS